MGRTHTIRIPVHGFVEFDDWERDIINHPVFQRLRRIRQLAFSEHVYPGSVHTRFEHSLGVMHVASRLFDALCRNLSAATKEIVGKTKADRERNRKLLRLAALLHDVGHGPLSHGAEIFAPMSEDGTKLKHEHFSLALIREKMDCVITNHSAGECLSITAKDIAELYQDGSEAVTPVTSALRSLVNGELDADRMDYLLRDAHHCGVPYGQFDLERIIDTIRVEKARNRESKILLSSNGLHSAEQLILARFMMFVGVYFHKTRVACDIHSAECLKGLLEDRFNKPLLPDPSTGEGRDSFLSLDDWTLYQWVADSKCDHAKALREHRQFKRVHFTPERPDQNHIDDLDRLTDILDKRSIEYRCETATKSWYKPISPSSVFVWDEDTSKPVPLPNRSAILAGLDPIDQRMVFVWPKDLDAAKEAKDSVLS